MRHLVASELLLRPPPLSRFLISLFLPLNFASFFQLGSFFVSDSKHSFSCRFIPVNSKKMDRINWVRFFLDVFKQSNYQMNYK